MAPGRTHQDAVIGRPDAHFDPSAFALQPAGTLGNLGRGVLIGPDLGNLDLAAMKNTRWSRLGEGTNLQFRVEAFNLLNRPNFGPPALLALTGDPDNERPLGSLGRIRSTITSSRQIQLGLRISFEAKTNDLAPVCSGPVLSWGAYGPTLHKGQLALDSQLRALL